jgi:hypothetical protein
MTKPRFGYAMKHRSGLLRQFAVLALLSTGLMTLASAALAQAGAFVFTGNMSLPRSSFTATLLNNGKVLVAGGGPSSAELYDPMTGIFTITGSMTTAVDNATATLLNNGKVLIAGGSNASTSATVATAELYDPTSETFAATGNMSISRQHHTATLLNNGMVLIAGGDYITGPANAPVDQVVATAELYDPTSGTFTATGNMTDARTFHTATPLNNGKVLVAGGADSIGAGNVPNAVATADLYDPAKGIFSATGSMTTSRERHSANQLSNGNVLIAAGANQADLASAELYNPVTGTFTVTGSMATARIDHTATLLNNGMVLVAGGAPPPPFATSDAEVYAPATGVFFETGLLKTPRYLAAAALLNNGNVLVAGGVNLNGGLISAELYELPDVSLSTTAIGFGNEISGISSASQSIILTNNQASALDIATIAITGTNPSDFSPSNTCGTSLASEASCLIGVNFTPIAGGTRSSSVTITDNAPGSPQIVTLSGTGQDFAIAPTNQSTITVTAGQTASFPLTVSTSGGFSQTVAFTCSGAPPGAACSISPSSVTLNGSTASIIVAVTTTAASLTVNKPPASGPSGIDYRPSFINFGLLWLGWLVSLRGWPGERASRVASGLTLPFLLAAASTMSACGGGVSSRGTGSSSAVTHAGVYTLTVSGTFASGSNTLTRTTVLTLVVQ